MKRSPVAILSFVLLACKASAPPPIVAPVASVSGAPRPAQNAPNPNRFGAGPGVTLVLDQLYAAAKDSTVDDLKAPYADRLGAARAILGVLGEPVKDDLAEGTGFVAIGGAEPTGRGEPTGPWGCHELVIAEKGPKWLIRNADFARCGLPYLADPTKPFHGRAPHASVVRLRELAASVAGMNPLDAELAIRREIGFPEPDEAHPTWYGIGPRGPEAPLTCYVLTIRPTAKVIEAPLSTCGYIWPPPRADFDPGPAIPALDRNAVRIACAKSCGVQQICVLDERTPYGASIRRDPDGLRAHYIDGRPAKAELVASCASIPTQGCPKVSAGCFFKRPAPPPNVKPLPAPPTVTAEGPCPKETFTGYSFDGTEPPFILCRSRIGGPTPQPSPAP